MIEVHYWACNNPDQQDEHDVWIHNRSGFVSVKLADYMLNVRDDVVKVKKIDAKHNGVLFSIKAPVWLWEHYAWEHCEEDLGEHWSIDEDEDGTENEDEGEDEDPETRRYWKDRNEKVIRIW